MTSDKRVTDAMIAAGVEVLDEPNCALGRPWKDEKVERIYLAMQSAATPKMSEGLATCKQSLHVALLQRAADFAASAPTWDFKEDRCVMTAVHLAADIREALSRPVLTDEEREAVKQARGTAHAISQYHPEDFETGELFCRLADLIDRLTGDTRGNG